MEDALGRAVDYLRVSVTDRCSLRCLYCMPPEGIAKREHAQVLSLEEIEEIIGAAVALGVRKVRVTGGEPLVRRGVVGLCARVARMPGIRELTMTTNGVALPEHAVALRSAGVSRLNISLDTLRADRYARITRCGTLAQAMAGLEAARAAGFENTKLNIVLIGGVNDDEIADFVALTRAEALQVRFIELMPLGACAAWPPERFLSADAVLAAAPSLRPEGGQGVAEVYRAPGHAGTVGLIRPMTGHFCAACNRIRLTADGRLKPCLHSGQEVAVRGLHGQALEAAVRGAILAKPAGHTLCAGGSGAGRDMHEIGG